MTDLSKVNVLMVGTGEYTTGYVGGTAADSDKVERVGMCGVNVSANE